MYALSTLVQYSQFHGREHILSTIILAVTWHDIRASILKLYRSSEATQAFDFPSNEKKWHFEGQIERWEMAMYIYIFYICIIYLMIYIYIFLIHHKLEPEGVSFRPFAAWPKSPFGWHMLQHDWNMTQTWLEIKNMNMYIFDIYRQREFLWICILLTEIFSVIHCQTQNLSANLELPGEDHRKGAPSNAMLLLLKRWPKRENEAWRAKGWCIDGEGCQKWFKTIFFAERTLNYIFFRMDDRVTLIDLWRSMKL